MCKILETKIQIPKMQQELIRRERLLKKLKEAQEKFIVLQGGTGYGKTALLFQYTIENKEYTTWYSLKKEDNDLGVFFSYFVQAVKDIVGEVTFFIQNYPLFEENRKTEIKMINDFVTQLSCIFLKEENKKKRFVIILDNFEEINNPDIFLLLAKLIINTPDNFKLYFATERYLPEFMIGYFIKGKGIGIGVEELKFNKEETKELLQKKLGEVKERSILEEIEYYMEGWAVGIKLTILYLRQKRQKYKIFENRMIYEYFWYELFVKLSLDIQEFLIKTSVLSELEVDRCNFVLKIKNAQYILEYLYQNNLFIFHIGDTNNRYQYHTMFQIFLKTKVSSKDKKEILEEEARYQLKQKIEKKTITSYIKAEIFGAFKVIIEPQGHQLSWRTKKAGELFALLLDRNGDGIEREQLLRMLWPENYPNNAIPMLHNMLYSIRKELMPYGLENIIEYKEKRYHILMDFVQIDNKKIEEICEIVEKKEIEGLLLYREYFEDYKGGYLENIDCEWVDKKRYYYERIMKTGTGLLAEFYFKNKEYYKAISFYKNILKMEPFSEEAAKRLMKAYQELGEIKKIKELYIELKKRFQSELGIKLSDNLEKRYKECIKIKKI